MTPLKAVDRNSFDVIFLDFDGVVVESNGIKHEAFLEIFKRNPEKFDELTAYHYANNHVGRRQKFEYIATSILRVDDPVSWTNERTNEFTALTRKKIIACPFVRGASSFLERQSLTVPLVLVSATPHEELEIILHEREIRCHFEYVFGAPLVKTQILQRVVRDRGFTNPLFIGDSPEDLTSARQANVAFLGLVGSTDFDGENVPVVLDLEEAATWIEGIR